MIDFYKIEGAVNLDNNCCFDVEKTYPNFQKELEIFKDLLITLVNTQQSKTFYKYGDGDYHFLKKQEVGSATPGKRALSKRYDEINHDQFIEGSLKCDYYTCEIYPENRERFSQVISKKIDFPAEYGYGLIANKWITKTFSGNIGIIGADSKVNIIKNLMKYSEYQEYLGTKKFEDYVILPQKFACDDIDATERMVGEQLKGSKSKLFLMGMGHVKSGLIHRLKKYTDAVFLDVGSGIDALAGIIDIERPYFGDWTNYQINDPELYNNVDYLQYFGKGKTVLLEKL